jgi:hypothetical protein
VSSFLCKLDVRKTYIEKLTSKSMTKSFYRFVIIAIISSIAFVSCTNQTKDTPELILKEKRYSDKIHLLGNENYAACEMDIIFKYPTDSIYYQQLKESMTFAFFDSLTTRSNNLEDLMFLAAQSYTDLFKEQEEYLQQDTLDFQASMNWQIIIQNDIFFKSPRYISFMNENYGYTGGAHGNTIRSYFTFDLETNKLLSSSEVFFIEKYPELIELQKASLVKAGHEIEGFWLEGLKVDQDFYVVENGIVFHYDQYEIASYAAGPIDIFISFEEAQPLLQNPEQFEQLIKK